MSNAKGELIESLQAGTCWMNAYENIHPETGNKYLITVLSHAYQDNKTGEWKQTNRYSVGELADLHYLTGKMLDRLRVKDHGVTTEKETGKTGDSQQDLKLNDSEGKFQKKENQRRAAKKAAKKTTKGKEIE